MKKWLFALALLLAPTLAHATCVPAQATVGMIGCWTVAPSMSSTTDYLDIWKPGAFPNSAQLITPKNLMTSAGGPFLPLAGGTMTGTSAQNITTTWAGTTYPGTNNVAFYSAQTYVGTPNTTTGYFSDSFGREIPLSLGYISSDQLNWQPGVAGAVFGWEFKHQFGGGSANGARTTLSVDTTLVGTIGTSNVNFGAIQAAMGATSNVAGATSGMGGLGDFFTYSGYYGRFTSGVFAKGAIGMELDYAPSTGSTIDVVNGIKIVNFAPLTYHATSHEAVLAISTQNTGVTGTWDHVITFGDYQSSGGGFPGSATGDLIMAFPGATATVMDFSALTISDSLLKGPDGLRITGTGLFITAGPNTLSMLGATNGNAPTLQATAATDAVVGMNFKTITGTTGKFVFLNANNDRQFEIDSVTASISRAVFSGAASGTDVLFDVTGTATGITIGGTAATSVRIGSATADQVLGSGAFLPTLNATSGFVHLPFTNVSSGAGGIPTGTPANTSGPSCQFNDVTFTLNCYSPSAGAWKHVTLSAGAG